jgi:hypothetical protein
LALVPAKPVRFKRDVAPETLRAWREARGLSRKAAAERLGLTERSVATRVRPRRTKNHRNGNTLLT